MVESSGADSVCLGCLGVSRLPADKPDENGAVFRFIGCRIFYRDADFSGLLYEILLPQSALFGMMESESPLRDWFLPTSPKSLVVEPDYKRECLISGGIHSVACDGRFVIIFAHAAVAQLAEQCFRKAWVGGSSPLGGS